jgi:hypothetical protein
MLKKMLFCAGIICSTYGAINAQIINFEDLSLSTDTFWNGADLSGGFTSGIYAHFPNNFVDYGGGVTAWDGFAYSNKVNDSTQEFSNMYSCYAGQIPLSSTIFGVSYNPMNYIDYSITPTEVSFLCPAIPQSMSITNSTYSALTVKNGDMFCKPFGGVTGDDPDWFKLDIIGYNNSVVTDTVHFYLADYRFSDNSEDYIIKEWTTIDLSSLGQITKIAFVTSSSDTGSYGMNTPAFFCFDDLSCTFLNNIVENNSEKITLYPNPAFDKINCSVTLSDLHIYSMDGQEVYCKKGDFRSFDLSDMQPGFYMIKMKSEGKEYLKKIVKK